MTNTKSAADNNQIFVVCEAQMPVILIRKTHSAVLARDNPAVGYGHFMSISSQIFYYLRRVGKRTFGINRPRLRKQWSDRFF
jgi:hypothetical protein